MEGRSRADGNSFATVGLLKMQLADDSGAVNSFVEAEKLNPSDPMISYCLAQSLMRLGETDKSLEAYSRAIEKRPTKADGLVLFQDYGKALQRLGRDSEAQAVWLQLDQMFPGDMQVQERIARLLYDEGVLAQSLVRYQKLASASRDRLQSVEASMQAAEIKSLLGKHDEALADLEVQISRVNPESWLYRDGRRRIEDVFRRQGKADQLIQYYASWMAKHADDVEALQRCVSLLSNSGQYEQAEQLLMATLEKVPSNVEARRALVQLLIKQGKHRLATDETLKLLEQQPDNADLLLELGELHLSNSELELAERQRLAAEAWLKLLIGHEKEPARVAQVAELISRVEMPEKAIRLFQQAIDLQPEDAKYREYMGEYLHKLGRKQEAKGVWQEIVSTSRGTYENLTRLSEVYQTFEWMDEAIEAQQKASAIKSRFESHARLGHLLHMQARHDDAMVQWIQAEALADSAEQITQAINAQVETLAASGQLVEKLVEAKRVANEKPKDAARWRWLSKLYQASGNRELACTTILHASEIKPTDLAIAREAAALVEAAGKWSDATAIYERLVQFDPQNKGKHLKSLMELRARLGDIDGAIQAGKTLVASAPSNADYRNQLASLYAAAGQVEASRAELRQAVRRNPKDVPSLLRLAAALAESIQSAEAIEIYWRAMTLATSIDQQQSIVTELSHLYYRSNRVEVLIDRLRGLAIERSNPRDGLVWLTIVYRTTYDYGNARVMLEKLAADYGSDPMVLEQLVTASKIEDDWDAAISYQRRLCDLSPSKTNSLRLIAMLLEREELDEAIDYLQSHSIDESDVDSILELSDDLSEKGRWDVASMVLDAALKRKPNDWELSIVSALVHMKVGNRERAHALACEVLDTKLKPSEPSRRVAKSLSGASRYARWSQMSLEAPARPTARVNEWRELFSDKSFSLFSENRDVSYWYGATKSTRPSSTIDCLSDARMAAFQIFRVYERQAAATPSDSLSSRLRQLETSDTANALWEAVAIRSFGKETQNAIDTIPEVKDLLDRLVKLGDPYAVDIAVKRILRPLGESANKKDLDASTKQIAVKQAYDVVRSVMDKNDGTLPHSIGNLLKPLARLNRYDDVIQLVEQASQGNASTDYQMIQFVDPILELFPVPESLEERFWMATEKMLKKWLDASASGVNGIDRIEHHQLEYLWDKAQGLSAKRKLAISNLIIRWRISQHANYVDAFARHLQISRISFSAIGELGNGSEVTLLFPPVCEHMSGDIAKVLHMMAKTIAKDGDLTKLIEMCSRESMEESSVDGKCIWKMSEASLFAWSGQFDNALRCVDECAQIAPNSEFVEMGRAYIYVARDDLPAALSSIEKIRPTSNRMSIEREQAIVQLQLQLGRMDAAKQTVQRLLGQQLNTETLMAMSRLAGQLGMQTASARSVSKLKSTAGGNIESLVALMQRHVEDDNMESAVEIAREVIGRSGIAIQGAKKESLRSALETLQKANQLDAFVATQEQLLEKSPKSQQLIRYLMDCYRLMGRQEDAGRMAKLLADKTSKAEKMFDHGHLLQLYGDYQGAAQRYLEGFTIRPNFTGQERHDFSEIAEVFDRVEGSWDQLVNIVLNFDRDKLSALEVQPLFEILLRRRKFDALNRLMIPNIAGAEWQPLEHCLTLFIGQGIIPSEDIGRELLHKLLSELPDLSLTDWEQILARGFYYSENERLTPQLVFQLTFAHQDLANQTMASLAELGRKYPENHAIRVSYALALIQANQFDRVVELLNPVLDDPSFSMQDGLVKLVVDAISSKSPNATAVFELTDKLYSGFPRLKKSHLEWPLENTPLHALAKYFKATGNKAAHRELLMEQFHSLDLRLVNVIENRQVLVEYSDEYIGIARSLLEMGFPLDALLAYQAAEQMHIISRLVEDLEWPHELMGKTLLAEIKPDTLAETLIGLLTNSPQGKLDDLTRRALCSVQAYRPSEKELRTLAAIDSLLSLCTDEQRSQRLPIEAIRGAVQATPNEETTLCQMYARLAIQNTLEPKAGHSESKLAFMMRLDKEVASWIASKQANQERLDEENEDDIDHGDDSSLRYPMVFSVLAASTLPIWNDLERVKLLESALRFTDPKVDENLNILLMLKITQNTANSNRSKILEQMLDSIIPRKERAVP